MPMAATGSPSSRRDELGQRRLRSRPRSRRRRARPSPGRGKCWVNSRYGVAGGRARRRRRRRRGRRWCRRRWRSRRPCGRTLTRGTASAAAGDRSSGARYRARSAARGRDVRPMRVGMLTGGGDCPGLNAVHPGRRPQGRAGLRRRAGRLPRRLAGRRSRATSCRSTSRRMRGTLPRGGTDPRVVAHQPVQGRRRRRAVQADARATSASTRSSPSAARTRSASPASCTATGVARSSACPRRSTTTSSATELTFGFDTAVQICVDAIDRLHTTAESTTG